MGLQFAFPFSLDSAGRVRKVDQSTSAGRRDMAAHLIMTRRRERGLSPNFGITDPVFAGVDRSEIMSNVNAYLGDDNVSIESIDVSDNGNGTQRVTINVR